MFAMAVSIGPVTSDAVRAAGITLAAEAADASIDALADTAVKVIGGESTRAEPPLTNAPPRGDASASSSSTA